MRYLWKDLFSNKRSVSEITGKFGKTMTKFGVGQYVKKKLNDQKDQERQRALEEFLMQIVSVESTTETAIFDLFESPLFPRVPVLEDLRNKPISFVYGEFDWVVSTGAEVLVTEASKNPEIKDECNLYIVPGAEH